MEIARDLTCRSKTKTRGMARVMQQSTFGGRRSGLPVQYVLQATSIEKLREVFPEFMDKVNESPAFQMADVNLKFTRPELRIHLNREKAALMGVSTQNIGQTLQLALSGQRFGYFFMNGNSTRYWVKCSVQTAIHHSTLNLCMSEAIQVIWCSLTILSPWWRIPHLPSLYRYNRFVSATVSAGLADGWTIGQALDEMDRISDEVLDDTFRTALAGDSKDFRKAHQA
jgi:multidrug efflux pump